MYKALMFATSVALTVLIFVAVPSLLSVGVRWVHGMPGGSAPFLAGVLPVAGASVLAVVATCRQIRRVSGIGH